MKGFHAAALACLALAHAIAPPGGEALVDGEIARGRERDQDGNFFDGGPCTSEQTRCSDGACCLTGSWACEKPAYWQAKYRGKNGRICWMPREKLMGWWSHLQPCDPENARSALCDGGKTNMSFLEGLGFPGQNCDDKRWLHAFLHDASDCPFGPSGDDYVCSEMALLVKMPPAKWDQQVRRAYAEALKDSTHLKSFDEICADRSFCAANGFGRGDARDFRSDSFKWLARHGDRARRCHAELLRGAPTKAWGRCCCKVVARIGPEGASASDRRDWEVSYRKKPKACKAAADAAGSGARKPGSLVDVGDDDDDDTLKDHEDDEDDRTTTNRLYDHVRDRLSTLYNHENVDDDYGPIITNREYERHCFLSDGSFFRDGRCRVKRYRLFKKSLRKRNLWPKMSSQEVAAYVAVAVAAAGAIFHVLRGRRRKTYDKYP